MEKNGQILMAPTGVHKERVRPQDLFSISPSNGKIVRVPKNKSLKLSECSPIFCSLITEKRAGSVMHSHALSAVLAADLSEGDGYVVIQNLEMLKGIRGVSNSDKHCVPVIQNTTREPDLLVQIHKVFEEVSLQSSFAILVRDHGAYIWGEDIWEAKRHAEIYHFLFEALVARAKRSPQDRQ